MNPNADITGFWKAWRKTCSIRRCLDVAVLKKECADIPEANADFDKIVKDAHDVIETTNRYFAGMIKVPRAVKPLKKYTTVASEADDFDMEEKDSIVASEGDEGDDAVCNEDGRDDCRLDDNRPAVDEFFEQGEDEVNPRQESFKNDGMRLGRGKMISEYCDLVDSWYRHDNGAISAFELVEIDLYRDAAEKTPEEARKETEEPKLNGKKLKNYLFEDVCAVSGNISKSLWGYLLKKDWTPNGVSRLRMVANASFRNSGMVCPSGNDEGEEEISCLPASDDWGNEDVSVQEAKDALQDYWLKRWKRTYDVTDRVAICCAFFKFTMSDPFVLSLVPVAKSALSARKQKRVEEVFSMLKKKRFDYETIRRLFYGKGEGQAVLYDIAIEGETKDPRCEQLALHFSEKSKTNGN